jgi:carbon-monoxide dehydrogenase small subunit
MDGRPVKSCTVLAVQADGTEISTVEGLEQGDQLHPLQTAFSEHHGLQCGYCTPGMLMSCKQLLEENPDPSREEIKKSIAGNVCRCTGYQNIYTAVEDAAKKLREA